MNLWPWGRAREQRETLANPSEAFARDLRAFFGLETPAGVEVSPYSAISGAVAVYACVRIIADAVSTLPMVLYRDQEGLRDKVSEAGPGPEASLARLLHRRPNPELSAQEYYETLAVHLLLWGNFYALIERGGDGNPRALWPLRPDRLKVMLIDKRGEVYEPAEAPPVAGLVRGYVYTTPEGDPIGLPRDEIHHVRGLGTNPYIGMSPIQVARANVGEYQAAAEYAGRFYQNSARPDGVLSFPVGQRALEKDDKKRIRREWNELYRGSNNAHRIAIMEGGVEWKPLGLPPKDAEFVETRRFQINEIARLYGIPPHLIGDVEKSTSWGTGIEQQTLGFLVYTLRPWLERIEQAIDRDLGSGRGGDKTLSERGLIAEFLVEGLLRGDFESRMRGYEVGIRSRILLPNEARRKENMPPLDGGDEPFTPLNFGNPDTDVPAGA